MSLILPEAKDMKTCVKKVTLNNGLFTVYSQVVIRESDFPFSESNFTVQIDEQRLPIHFTKKSYRHSNATIQNFKFQLAAETAFAQKVNPVYLVYSDMRGATIKKRIEWRYIKFNDSFSNYRRLPFLFSKAYINVSNNLTAFFYQTTGNSLSFTTREINTSDSIKKRRKIRLGYLLARLNPFSYFKNKIVFFEKFCEKYEESASILFEKCIDKNIKHVHFIIDKNTETFRQIPDQYKNYVVQRNSLYHYFLFFSARCFISTESMNHIIDTNIYSPIARKRVFDKKYRYIFLQHGVMYMYSLENRTDFICGKGMPKHTQVVISSNLEGEQFIENGKFKPENLILSGLPKFDRAKRNKNADNILIMPTNRGFEYNLIKTNPTLSTYYNFIEKLVNAVPDNLKDKIVVIPHPIIQSCLKETALGKYIPNSFSYDELLKNTALLLTDYSSIAYDAFYRGCKVIFCWEEKEFCLEKLGYSLMLNEKNVFSDVSKDYSDLRKLIQHNYNVEKVSDEYLEKFRKIVEFHDNRNTERCFDILQSKGIWVKKHKNKTSIKNTKISGIKAKSYTGRSLRQPNLELIYNSNVLIEGVDYLTIYANCTLPGKGIILILGIGKYRGFTIRTFKIKHSK